VLPTADSALADAYVADSALLPDAEPPGCGIEDRDGLEIRVPADLRAGLPLLASGPHVLWFPGQGSKPVFAGASRFVRVRLERAGSAPLGISE